MKRAWTIGHSTHSIEAFLALLAEHRIEALADVRRFPSSRKFPHFNAPVLKPALEERGIDYLALPELGGRRPPRKDSRNVAWRNASFRGYADYMETPGFSAGLQILTKSLETERTAIMCAEALWWRCHRALIADALKADGFDVCHIMKAGEACAPHPYTSAARIVGGRLFYGSGQEPLM